MEEFLSNLKNVALAPTLISFIVIFLVGCIKLIPGIKGMRSKDARKTLYQVLNIVLAGGLALGYHVVIVHGELDKTMIEFIGIVVAEVNVLYPLYENFGIRALFKKIVSLLIPSKAEKVDKVLDKVVPEEHPLSSAEVAAKQAKSEKTGWLQ